jgi:AAA+ superfamily predicted ATPase
MSESTFDKTECRALYEACTGGALIIKCGERIEGEITPEDRFLRAIFGEKYRGPGSGATNAYWLSTICKMALEYRDKALTIFCLPRTSERVKVKMQEQLDIMTLVAIAENFVSYECAKQFLKQTARKRNIKPDKSLYDILNKEQTLFSSSELLRAFDVWYSRRLKCHSYPQYSVFTSSGQISSKAVHSGDAFSELQELIGLNEAKTIIKQALDYFKVQRLLCGRGLSSHRPAMHMIFSGSPGTAKTTVARLFARILRENELLSVGKLYEVGRADLVGEYVGWTAKKVERKFAEAMGSVLFIDEAYSLVDDNDGCYGDEAISTIVSEMENRRDDIVVIFAGYTEKMEGFLMKNPGLRSRISFHVPFADYSPSELYQILEYTADKQSLILGKGVRDKLMPMLLKAGCEADFGNGRYIRNLLERARMNQAGRLLEMDINKITSNQATRLLAEDFEEPVPARAAVQRIGFYSA